MWSGTVLWISTHRAAVVTPDHIEYINIHLFHLVSENLGQIWDTTLNYYINLYVNLYNYNYLVLYHAELSRTISCYITIWLWHLFLRIAAIKPFTPRQDTLLAPLHFPGRRWERWEAGHGILEGGVWQESEVVNSPYDPWENHGKPWNNPKEPWETIFSIHVNN